MKTVQEQVNDFKQLSLEEKKKIVFKMFDDLKDVNENFKYVHETLPTIEATDELMEKLYQDLAELAEEKRTAIKELEMKKIEKINDRVKKIQEMEAKEKEEADGILDQVV